MEAKLVVRGALAGAIGGLLAFIFARIFAEPQIQKAIDYEAGRDAAQEELNHAAGVHDHSHEHELFSRTVQGNIGIGVGMIAFGIAMGILFALVFAVCLGRTGRVRPRSLALLVAGAGFIGMYLIPFAKYPANPPAIGHEDTIAARGALYLTMVGLSVALLIVAVVLGRRLAAAWGNWNASIAAGAGYLVAIGIAMALLPPFGRLGDNKELFGDHATETPLPLTDPSGAIVFPGFPADLLWDFRFYSVIAQLILWIAIGLVFAPLAERLLRPLNRRDGDVLIGG